MFVPSRLVYALRPHAAPGIVASAITVAVIFAATPFVIPEVASRLGVSVGAAGLISTMKVAGFAIANVAAPRLLRPSGRLLRSAAAVVIAANLASVWMPSFPTLMAMRLTVGLAAGILTWIAWSDAMSQPRSMRDVAVAGPLAGLIGTPLIGLLSTTGDDRAIYLLLAAAALMPLGLRVDTALARAPRGVVSRSRSNRVLLFGLLMLTASGSSLFVFLASFGQDRLGLDPFTVSLAFSLNAGAGMVAARLEARRGTAGAWLSLTAAAALLSGLAPHPSVYFAGLALWGFAFWMGIPEVFRAIADRSLTPSERTGDAQALMALGRAIGPSGGGAVLESFGITTLTFLAAGGLVMSAGIVGGVERYRSRVRTG